MKDNRTGQSFEKLLGAAKDRVNQTDHDISLEQKNRARDALAAEKNYNNATPLEKANINLENAKQKVEAIQSEKIGKNMPEEEYNNWQERLAAAKSERATAQKTVDKLSSKTKITAPKERTEDQRTKVAFHKTKEELRNDRNDLDNIKAEHSQTLGEQKKLKTAELKIDTKLTNVKSELENLKNPGLFTRLLNAISSSKQKEHKAKIENLNKQITELDKEKTGLSTQKN
ncbi:hypothetical protein D920_01668 [Enterococcus faecalis 13-SD-W-01]|nr:hypothetical protein D920_01668 [Enterococcus faecalis 13-SD-W-01]